MRLEWKKKKKEEEAGNHMKHVKSLMKCDHKAKVETEADTIDEENLRETNYYFENGWFLLFCCSPTSHFGLLLYAHLWTLAQINWPLMSIRQINEYQVCQGQACHLCWA